MSQELTFPERGTDDWNAAWQALAKALQATPLRDDSGASFHSCIENFMLMGVSGNVARFKDASTRNYVVVNVSTGTLSVPETGRPFEFGIFSRA